MSEGGEWKHTSVDNCCTSSRDSVPGGPTSKASYKEKAIRQMRENMEENRFCYIPRGVNIKRLDYLHYVRKRDEGAYTYAAHADYYILLRACALGWLEKRIDH